MPDNLATSPGVAPQRHLPRWTGRLAKVAVLGTSVLVVVTAFLLMTPA